MSKRSRYVYGARIKPHEILEVSILPATNWRKIIEIYPELRRCVKLLADKPSVLIHPATEHDTRELAKLLRAGIQSRREFNDRSIVLNQLGDTIQGFVSMVQTQEGIAVQVHRLKHGQPPLEIRRD